MSSQDLDKLLAALRDDTHGAQAPRHVEAALLSAFRTQSRTPARRGWMTWAMAAAAAVVVIIGAGVAGVKMMEQPAPPPPAVSLAVAPPAPPFAFERTVVPRPVRHVPRPRVESAKVEAPAVQEVATDFMPLEDSMSLPPIESGHVLRVHVPQSTMMRFGFPVNPERMMDPVKADVVFGQDGIARAVRFVR